MRLTDEYPAIVVLCLYWGAFKSFDEMTRQHVAVVLMLILRPSTRKARVTNQLTNSIQWTKRVKIFANYIEALFNYSEQTLKVKQTLWVGRGGGGRQIILHMSNASHSLAIYSPTYCDHVIER